MTFVHRKLDVQNSLKAPILLVKEAGGPVCIMEHVCLPCFPPTNEHRGSIGDSACDQGFGR